MRLCAHLATRCYFLPCLFLCLVGLPCSALAQNKSPGAKVDLDDVQIKGELLSDDRINMLARKKNSLNDKIPLRTSFRQDILEELPAYFDSAKILKSEKK